MGNALAKAFVVVFDLFCVGYWFWVLGSGRFLGK